jgi:hypothetical protein
LKIRNNKVYSLFLDGSVNDDGRDIYVKIDAHLKYFLPDIQDIEIIEA